MKKRIICVLLAAILLMTNVNITAFATESLDVQETVSGNDIVNFPETVSGNDMETELVTVSENDVETDSNTVSGNNAETYNAAFECTIEDNWEAEQGNIINQYSIISQDNASNIEDIMEFNGHYYQVFNIDMTWDSAKVYCENLGGHLATITSKEENDFVYSISVEKKTMDYWLGATDEKEEGNWKWITDEEWSYSNWASKQPDNNQYSDGVVGEDYLQMWRSANWNDCINNDITINGVDEACAFVCEWDNAEILQNIEYNSFVNRIPKLSDKDARTFLSFIYNSDKFQSADLSDFVYYQLLTGNYEDMDTVDRIKSVIESFSSFARTTMNQQAANSSCYVDYFSLDLLTFLENRLSESVGFGQTIVDEFVDEIKIENLDAELLEDIKAHKKDYIEDTLTDSDIENYVHNGFVKYNEEYLSTTDKEFITDLQTYIERGLVDSTYILNGPNIAEKIGNLIDGYKEVISGVEKGFEYAENLITAIEAFWIVMGSEINARCSYFNVYLNNRPSYESAEDDVFQYIMEYNAFALADNNMWGQVINPFTWISGKDSWNNHINEINTFAEYLFQLEKFLHVSEHNYEVCYVAATCEDAGYIKKYCSTCAREYSVVISEALGHCYIKDAYIAPSCNEVGYEEWIHCDRCCHSDYPRREIASLGHDYIAKIIKNPTVLEEGEKEFSCSRCGDTYIEKISKLEKYIMHFETNGGTISIDEKDIVYSLPIGELPIATKEGYIFEGWFINEIEITSETICIGNMTVYARWNIANGSIVEDMPEDGVLPKGIWSAGIKDMDYTGNSITQSFRLYNRSNLLKEKTDYTISYKNNKNAYVYLDEDYAAFEENLKNTGKKVKTGTFDPNKAPQVTIKMKGNYSGSQTIYFKIHQADITDDAFDAGNLTVTYSGKKQTPTPTLMWNGKKLRYGTDFYVPEYDNAKNDKKAFTDSQAEPYKLTVTGKGNFTGEIPITLTISNSTKQIAMDKVTVKGIANQKWTGDQIVQSNYKVNYSRDVLTEENGDFTVSWGVNKDVGTGTVTFTGTGEDADGDGYSYIGTKTVSFKITGIAMSKAVITGVDKSYTYTGEVIEPIALLTYKENKNTEAMDLEEGTHYTTAYQKNTDKGTATIIFTGLESGGFTGTKKITFKIVSSGIGDMAEGEDVIEQIAVSFVDEGNVQDGIYVAPYMKGGVKPVVAVTSGGKALELNKDYTISYSNNKKVALSTDKNAPSITIKGKGNYTGSKKVYFTIAAKPLSNENGVTIVANDKIVSLKKNGYRQGYKVYDSDGKALGSSDYDTKTVTYTLIRTENEDGTISMPNQILDKNSIVPINSVIRITVQGKGIYAGGEASGTYRILENSHDISKASIQINNQPYTGNPVLITDQSQFKTGKVYIKIGKTTEVLTLGEDIEVVSGSYVKNVNKGTAKVTFRGINEFGGTKTVSYTIGARSIGDFWKGIYTKVTKIFN